MRTFFAPAKLNFFLNILGKRNDGYHELFLDFIPIDFCDQITITPSAQFSFSSNVKSLESEQNLIVKAVRKLEKAVQKDLSVTIHLEKIIPSGAGLGGGSSDAATTLKACAQIFNLNLTNDELAVIATSLGADVPFFLTPKPAHARGIGEVLSYFELEHDLHILLIFPGFEIGTAEAYSNLYYNQKLVEIRDYSMRELTTFDSPPNHFWASTKQKYPNLETMLSELKIAGAIFCSMSGSGSTLFGVFKNDEEVRRGADYFSKKDIQNKICKIFRPEQHT